MVKECCCFFLLAAGNAMQVSLVTSVFCPPPKAEDTRGEMEKLFVTVKHLL